MTGAWPTTGDLLAAVPDGFRGALAGAVAERGMFDQPVVVSGQRAVVLPVELGGERLAVRFSLTDPTPNRPRYEAVNEALRRNPDLPLVHTTWEPAGMEIRGQLYPVMIMDWVDARPLADVVDDMVSAGDLDGVASLTTRLSGVFHDLEASGLVHGDIQHGNVMVSESTVTLVDYDSVLAADMPPHTATAEAGHPNYRHPGAAHLPGGRPNGDTFAATLIIASLNWVSARPELWRHHHGENLILDAIDLDNPDDSEAWREIDTIDLATSTAYARRVRDLLAMDPASLPPFSEAIALDEPLIPAGSTMQALKDPVPGGIPDDTTVISTAASRDRGTIPQDGGDKPTLGVPATPAASSVPPASSVPTIPVPVIPPVNQVLAGQAPTEFRPAASSEQRNEVSEPASRKRVLVPVTIAMVLLVVLGAAGAWFLFGTEDASDEESAHVVKVKERPSESDAEKPDDDKSATKTDDTVERPTTETTKPAVTSPPPATEPPQSGQRDCDVITSTSGLQWLETPPRCLDYTASGPLPTGSIRPGWFIPLASAVMTDPDAAATSQAQLDQFRSSFPGAVRVDSRLYRGMRDPVWAIVLPVSSESDALGYCSSAELSGVEGCTARHTGFTLDELQAGVRP